MFFFRLCRLLSASSKWFCSLLFFFLGRSHLLLESLGLHLLGLSLDLGTSFVVVRQIACLAHSHTVEESISVFAVESVLIPSKLAVARGAHVLGVVLSMHVRAFGDCHNIRFEMVVTSRTAVRRFFFSVFIFNRSFLNHYRWWLFLTWLGNLVILFLHKLLLDEVLE